MAAPDKFAGTAGAVELARAVARAAATCGWTADQAPMADGGEGTLEVVGGEARITRVAGPLGRPVEAEWRWLAPGEPRGRATAVIEMARAAGRSLLAHPGPDDPLRADTTGVGQLILAAARAGAGRIVVTVGGSATTDGGWGALRAIGDPRALDGIELVVACDVRTRFLEAARVFGPQKGATPIQVALLSRRLEELAARYRAEHGVDVESLDGSGAAGGLAGGLAVLGASLVPGFGLIAQVVGLARRLAPAQLAVTGEGRLDAGSLEGKVLAGVIELAGDRPVLCVVGQADPASSARLAERARDLTVVSLVEAVGRARAHTETVAATEEVVARYLRSFSRAGGPRLPPGADPGEAPGRA